ncbi:hypothetical protein, partial [Caulobacter sp. 17J65-9]|uniref:hypothetical protein n=1 Tax=Caulobacter sp. 17J65-9 TaxID=2709382 RepID=UPI0013CCA536
LALALACTAASPPRPPAPPPPPIDPHSEAFQAQMAQERAEALTRVSRSRENVTRSFYVGWEMHHGFYLIPVRGGDDDIVFPDFADQGVREQFGDFVRSVGPEHEGQKALCDCTGVAWTHNGQPEFLVRAARLTWVDGDTR